MIARAAPAPLAAVAAVAVLITRTGMLRRGRERNTKRGSGRPVPAMKSEAPAKRPRGRTAKPAAEYQAGGGGETVASGEAK